MNHREIVEAALEARTAADATRVQEAIQASIGARNQRWIADRSNNFGLMNAAGGSFDHKVLEVATNMQDAVIERQALRKWGDVQRVPYRTPHEAAADLFTSDPYQDVSELAVIEFHESEGRARDTKRLTVTFRDKGCGLTAEQMPETIFHLGSPHKEGVDWLQGAFGLGGATTFRNAQAIIVASRRDPELLDPGEEDRIALAVVQWEQHNKGRGAFYLVAEPWSSEARSAIPYSVPAAVYPDFEPGTYLALISYGVEGYHRSRLGDERSFDTVFNTRLFRPVLPVRFTNQASDRDRNEYLRGLERRLIDNPRTDRRDGRDVLPFRVNSTTYHLPISFNVFAGRGEPGERRKFVAYDHSVLFTSNGQVHHHWTPTDFRYRTRLNKLYDRILVVVETDELPIALRTDLFTADRSQMMRSEDALRLEDQVAAFLNEWHELDEINRDLIRQAIAGTQDERPTVAVARQISRALKIRGFSIGRRRGGRGGGGGGGGKPVPSEDLYDDPTMLEGPEHALAEAGKTKFLNFRLNAKDDFIPDRARLGVECDHPEIGPREVTVGHLRSGRVRVSIAVPLNAELGVFKLRVTLASWLRSSGGLGTPMEWTTKLEVVDHRPPRGRESGDGEGDRGAAEGELVALLWSTHEEQDEWDRRTVGEVQMVQARDLAERRKEYADLAVLEEAEVPTIMLNKEFYALKDYLGARAREIQDLDRVRDRYAVGAGVGLALLDEENRKRSKKGSPTPVEWTRGAQLAVGRSVLSMMPAFDDLAREAGLDTD